MGMSREHLYKAKRVNWMELPKEEWWVEGYYVKHGSRHWIYTGEIQYMYYPACADLPTKYEVEEETVCEYVGLQDKNKRKIFEWDICKDGDNVVRILWNDKHQWGVEISKTDFVLSKGLIFPLWQYDKCEENGNRELDVIGNVFDNPELLQNE